MGYVAMAVIRGKSTGEDAAHVASLWASYDAVFEKLKAGSPAAAKGDASWIPGTNRPASQRSESAHSRI
jgi:hypothetical protein